MRFKSAVLLAFGLVILGGCDTLQQGNQEQAAVPEPAPEPAPVEPLFTPEPGLEPRERLRKGLSLLEVGEAQHARVELVAYRNFVPDSDLAEDLIAQVDAPDPVAVLGPDYFTYIIRRGDSISSIAGRFLGDRMKFHILARYNGLTNARDITVGQPIKVPGKPRTQTVAKPKAAPKAPRKPSPPPSGAAVPPEPDAEVALSGQNGGNVQVGTGEDAAAKADDAARQEAARQEAARQEAARQEAERQQEAARQEEEAARQEEAAEAAAQDASERRALTIKLALLDADGFVKNGDLDRAANHLEEGLLKYPDSSELKEKAVTTYLSLATQHEQEGRLVEAESALRRASELAPRYLAVVQRLAILERRRKIDGDLAKAAQLQSDGLPAEAFDVYRGILELDPGNQVAQQKLESVRPLAANDLHRKATAAFRQEELEKAVGHWDRLLQDVDPDHSQAKAGRAQALELQEKIKKIEESNKLSQSE